MMEFINEMYVHTKLAICGVTKTRIKTSQEANGNVAGRLMFAKRHTRSPKSFFDETKVKNPFIACRM